MIFRPIPIVMLVFTTPVLAENEDPVAQPPVPCRADEYRQFDFWIGDWNVTEKGQVAGSNSVHSIQGGCAIKENWQGAGEGGISGTSFNSYDQVTGKWHQTWIDSSGTLLLLDGGLVDGVMVMSGERPARDGSGMVLHRISWTANPDGSVRQFWEASKDAGANWTALFDGLYVSSQDSP